MRWSRAYTEEEMQSVREHDIATAIMYGKQKISSDALIQKQNTSESEKRSEVSLFEKIAHFWIVFINAIARKR